MSRVIGALVAAWIVAGLTGCASPPPPSSSPRSPTESPEQVAPSQRPAPDACAELTSADVTAAIAALPGWSYDFFSIDEGLNGTPGNSNHSSVDYVGPDRVREVYWDEVSVRHGTIYVGDRMWWYAGSPKSSPVGPAGFARMLEQVFPLRGSNLEDQFPFPGDLPGEGLRESPRVLDTQCLATDPNTGTSLVTTRSGQLVRMISRRRLGDWNELRMLMFRATPPAIEPPSAADLKTTPTYIDPAKRGRPDPAGRG